MLNHDSKKKLLKGLFFLGPNHSHGDVRHRGNPGWKSWVWHDDDSVQISIPWVERSYPSNDRPKSFSLSHSSGTPFPSQGRQTLKHFLFLTDSFENRLLNVKSRQSNIVICNLTLTSLLSQFREHYQIENAVPSN